MDGMYEKRNNIGWWFWRTLTSVSVSSMNTLLNSKVNYIELN
ncbi:hypothetical protein MTsDn5_26480 [Alteromonas gracilis]